MLVITIPPTELFNESNSTFYNLPEVILSLEHSLVSLSKWESKWCVPFLTDIEKTKEQNLDYIKSMTITQNVDQSVYTRLTDSNFDTIEKYIQEPMTATTFTKENSGKTRDIITSEVIYSWMVILNIPFECQKWHLNRLLTLVHVCNIMSKPPKKVNRKAAAQKNNSINQARKAQLNTRG